MDQFTFIVFGDSGIYLSKLLKKRYNDVKIIHFLDCSCSFSTDADIVVNLATNFSGCISNEYARNEYLSIDESFNKNVDIVLNGITNAIAFDDFLYPHYPIILNITKKLLDQGICCHNIFFKPFKFFGKRRLDYYKDFYKEITSIKNNNHYFLCENIKVKEKDVIDLGKIVSYKQFDIAVSIIKKGVCSSKISKSNKRSKKEFTYVSVIYDDDFIAKTVYEPSYYYKTDIKDIDIDDKVLVDRNGSMAIGIVIDIENFDEDSVPFPIDKTKDIIKIIEKANLDS